MTRPTQQYGRVLLSSSLNATGRGLLLSQAALIGLGSYFLMVGAASAADTIKLVTDASNLSSTATYSPIGAPSASTDVEFQNITYTSPVFTANTTLTVGSLNDLNTSQSLFITSGSTAGTINITNGSSPFNSVSPSTNDAIYVAASASLTVQSGAANMSLVFNGTNGLAIDSQGTLNLNGLVSNVKAPTFTGSGATNVAGNISGSGSFTINTGTGGSVAFSGTNTYGGATTMLTGLLRLNSTSALGTGVLTLNNTTASNTIDNTTAGAIQMNNSVLIMPANNYGFTFAGTSNISFGSTGAFSVSKQSTIALNGTRKTITAGTWTNLANTSFTSTVNGANNSVIFSGMKLNNIATGGTAQTATFNGSGNIMVTGAISNGDSSPGNQSLTYSGQGIFTMLGSNSYSGTTTVSTGGTLDLKNAGAFGGNGAVVVGTNSGLNYIATSDAQLALGSTLGITGGASTALGGSIGSTITSAEINVAGNATTNAAAVKVNVFGMGVSASTSGSGTYTLLHGTGAGSTINNATYTLGAVYNNSTFTVGALSKSASDLQIAVTSATALLAAYWVGTATAGLANVWAASDGSATSNWAATQSGTIQTLIPGSGADVFISGNSPIAPTSTTLGADMTINSLTIQDTANGLGLNYDGNTLTIAGANGITVNASVPSSTIAANVAIGVDQTWTNNSANTFTVSGNIGGGSHSLTTAGTGTIVLSGINTYGGTTTVSGGTLLVNGTHSGAGAYTVNSGAILGGSGFIATAGTAGITIASGGKLSPGSTAGVIGNLTFTLGSAGGGTLDLSAATATHNGELMFDLGPSLTNDKVVLTTGTLVLSSLSASDFTMTTTGATVGQYVLFDTNNTVTFSGGTLDTSLSTFGGVTGFLSLANGNQDVVLNVTAVPEPASASVMAIGAIGLLSRRRRKLVR